MGKLSYIERRTRLLIKMQELEIDKVSDEQVKMICELLVRENAVLIAHYYTDPAIQYLAEKTKGFIGDSLAMARFGYKHSASTLIIAGVRFMGESAKILSPEKRVLMPTLQAECSLDLSCPIEKFIEFCGQYPDRTKVVYANCSAAVKAHADWVVTSSNAIAIIDYLSSQGEKILWAPDRYLGQYIQKQTDADMVMWDGSCIVHEEFIKIGIEELKKQYPEAGVLVHPESPPSVIDYADVVGSTSQLIKASGELAHPMFIVATDRAIFYKMQQAVPDKLLIQAPTAGHGATCQSCGHCPWMAMNTVELLIKELEQKSQEIILEKSIMDLARISLQRMIKFNELSPCG